ncbi:unnamed protein product [Strongylus vulgaris]|uniref:Uncharacterized protein n=1 Tax=Strongylus vulgaris TaxID=40348 RepID=A0A3P7JIK9_STRVU|nr:unnamed protein product [Strongylus vulgaris]
MNDKLTKVKTIESVHGKGDSRVVTEFDSHNIISRLLWLGYSEGRCASLWKRNESDDDVAEPFDELCRLSLDVDPFDMCNFTPGLTCVSFNDGSLSVLDNMNDKLTKVKTIESVHGKGDSRVVTEFDSHNIISGSSNGSLAKVDIESGTVTSLSKVLRASIVGLPNSVGFNYRFRLPSLEYDTPFVKRLI